MIIKRSITKHIKEQTKKYPIIALTGPRQSGKTTLLKELFSEYEYLTLENPDTRDFAENDPVGFLKQYHDKVILDEVQRVPNLFSYLQNATDRSKIMGQYILSGSQNFHLMRSITQTLAGRVALFKLLPFDFNELKNAELLSESYEPSLIKGFYPAIYDRAVNPKSYYANYIQTYVERDVTELINIKDLRLFRNFLGLCAARSGQLLNLNDLARECGISQPTAKSWLSILESSYIIFLLQPYYKNFSKRIVKSPKLYFYDTGLLCFLLKIYSEQKLLKHSLKGNLFENLIVAEFYKRNEHEMRYQDIYFWRDSAGNEIDMLIEDDKGNTAYEIKSTQTVTSALFKDLNNYEKITSEEKAKKVLIYSGTENKRQSCVSVYGWKNC
jgi:predicted AAA+ superfamily ATPase